MSYPIYAKFPKKGILGNPLLSSCFYNIIFGRLDWRYLAVPLHYFSVHKSNILVIDLPSVQLRFRMAYLTTYTNTSTASFKNNLKTYLFHEVYLSLVHLASDALIDQLLLNLSMVVSCSISDDGN